MMYDIWVCDRIWFVIGVCGTSRLQVIGRYPAAGKTKSKDFQFTFEISESEEAILEKLKAGYSGAIA